MEQALTNFIKYCLAYVRLTRERSVTAAQKYSLNLPKTYLELSSLLSRDTESNVGELINLEKFYNFDPKNVPEFHKAEYEKEKTFANKIEEIYNKHRNDQFTKEVILNFGYFEIELPVEEHEDELTEFSTEEPELTFPAP